jgi:hypothetical protein
MAQEYTQEQLERMVQGDPIDPTVTFFEQAILEPTRSREAGRRIYENRLMIKRVIPGVTDYVAQRATAEDVRRWPEEYQEFKNRIQERKSPSLEVIPGIDNVERQELIDRGYGTVARLAAASDVPAHLEHIKASAIRINKAFQAEEQHNANQEESKQEGSEQEARNGSATHRPDNHPAVRQLEVPRVQAGEQREDRQGHEEGRRDNHRKGIIVDDWKVEMVWRPQ